MDFTWKGFRTVLVSIGLIAALGLMSKIRFGFHAPGPILYCVVFNSIYVLWGFSIRRRFPQRQMRNYMTLLVLTFVMLNLLRTAKYAFVLWGGAFSRHLWYAYYIPMVFAPTLMFNASLNFGKPDEYKSSKLWNLIYIPAFLIVLGVMTNDLHQLAFRFAPDFLNWQSDYTYGPIYFIALGWIALNVAGVFVLAVRSTINRRLLKTAWLPMSVIIIGGVLGGFGYLFGNDQFSLIEEFLNFPDYVCLFIIAIWESLVIARIVTSNKGYTEAFAASSINAGLADGNFEVMQTSASGIRPEPETLRAAKNSELLLPDGNTLLKIRPVSGGWFYWTEDISELRRLKKALDETSDFLSEKNEMMRVTSEIEEERKTTAEKTALYDSVTESLRPQLERLSDLTEDCPADEGEFRERLGTIGVLLAYVKRRSFLLLAENEMSSFCRGELQLCLEESVKALRIAGIPCELSAETGLTVPSRDAVELFEAFETALEASLFSLSSASMTLAENDGCVELKADFELNGDSGEDVQKVVESAGLFCDDRKARFVPAVKKMGGAGYATD